MNWTKLLELIIWLLSKIKDSDGDGRPDIVDSEPENGEVK